MDRRRPGIAQGLEFSARARQRNIERLKEETFDILVIGGGVTGCGIARDAAMRGFSTALVEKEDFASGTSSKSSKLIHGGLRYLENFEFRLVFEASAERRRLRRLAPHLVKPLAFIFPVYRGGPRSFLKIQAGMWLYDLLAAFRNIKMHRMLRPRDLVQLEPAIDRQDLVGGARFYDCAVDDARLTLATAQSAARHGAAVANHVEVLGLVKIADKVNGALVRDAIGGEEFPVRARVTINATGPWGDTILRMDDPQGNPRLRPTKGVHILVRRDRVGNRNAVSFTAAQDRRLMFLIPWGHFAIIGTTDTDYSESLDRVAVEASDIAYILEAFNRAFRHLHLEESDIVSAYASLRPLVAEGVVSSYKVSREHSIVESPSGLLSIMGGKLTTYRVMAKQTVDVAQRRLEREFGVTAARGCETDRHPLEGGARSGLHARIAREADAACRELDLGEEVGEHLLSAYGANYGQVLKRLGQDRRLAEPLAPGLPYLKAELPHAVEHEMALSISDFLMRRTRIFLEDQDQGLGLAEEVAAAMGDYLNWTQEERARQLDRYAQQVALSRQYRQASQCPSKKTDSKGDDAGPASIFRREPMEER
ncbi:MAG: glycerol-3-phosphate dehydrogenase [Chloroflexota bacterium]